MNHLLLLHRLLVRPNTILRSFLYHSSLNPNDTLQRRVARSGDPNGSIITVLDDWIDQGRLVKSSELHSIIKMLRKFNRFSHALQISEWMSVNRVNDISEGDVAIRLDLIAKVCGLGEAEKFFDTVDLKRRSYHLYGALLNCYASKKALYKAEQVFHKMKELGFVRGCLSYNVMLNLYIRSGNYVMVEKVVKEMEEGGVKFDVFTFN